MPIMRVLVDGQSFDAKLEKQDVTKEALDKAAADLGANLSRLEFMSIELINGGFLVLSDKAIERAVFMFLP